MKSIKDLFAFLDTRDINIILGKKGLRNHILFIKTMLKNNQEIDSNAKLNIKRKI